MPARQYYSGGYERYAVVKVIIVVDLLLIKIKYYHHNL